MSLTRLPEEIILDIVRNISLVHECLGFLRTCRSLWSLTNSRIFWIHILECARWYRPVKLSASIHEIQVEALKESIAKAMKLDRVLTEKKLDEPARVWELVPPPDQCRQQADSEGPDPQLWTWLLEDGIHLMSMSKSGLMRLWNMPNKNVLSIVDVQGVPLCWDHSMDELGITMIVNTEPEDGDEEFFRVWRCDWSDLEPRRLISREMRGNIRSNWISGEMTGCVGIDHDSNAFIHAFSWKSLDEVYIKSEFKFSPYLSTTASKEDVILYEEDNDGSHMACWSLTRLKQLLGPEMEVKTESPHLHHYYPFTEDRPATEAPWLSIVRRLWDGRIGAFSRCMIDEDSEEDYVTLSILDDEENSDGFDDPWMEQRMARWIKGAGLAISLDEWDMCSIGTFGKTAIWLEGPSKLLLGTTPYEIERICFANFPPPRRPGTQTASVRSDDSLVLSPQSKRSGTDSPISASDPAALQEATDTTSQVLPEETLQGEKGVENRLIRKDSWETITDSSDQEADQASGSYPRPKGDMFFHENFGSMNEEDTNEEIAPLVTSQHTSPTSPIMGATHDNVGPSMELASEGPMNGSNEEAEPNLGSSTRLPETFGDTCEFSMPQKWIQDYKSIYMVDFDDARGRLAFATGSGKILMVELV
ncbi:hypothetical protein CPB86DRAFT_784457 [Serendipita vermifera]|nr:hypothetical protein CPB86DRAFT_784457 [Serendipita vermifera]